MRWASYLTSIHHHGFNILGALQMLMVVGLLVTITSVFDPNWGNLPRALTFLVYLVGVAIVGGIDVLWRWRSEPEGTWLRFLHCDAGGSILHLPFWLLLGGTHLAFGAILLYFVLTHPIKH